MKFPNRIRSLFSRRYTWILLFLLVGFIPVVVGWQWSTQLRNQIRQRLAERRFAPPLELWHQGQTLRTGDIWDMTAATRDWQREGYRSRNADEILHPGDFSRIVAEDCLRVLEYVPANTTQCVGFNLKVGSRLDPDARVQYAALDSESRILGLWRGTPPQTSNDLELDPQLFAEYYGSDPVLRKEVSLGETPPMCLNALLAIEDADFLHHRGVSATGLARALWTNLIAGSYKQGGSTVTQQLVKNYFLSSERTLKRKIKEIAMAVLLESELTKDEILEVYINLIYLGQNGPFQIRGYGAAAEYYFGRPLAELQLADCALLAAIVNSPGLFNPFTQPENAGQRRTRVLERMRELNLIEDRQLSSAARAPLPQRPAQEMTDTAPYFVDAVVRKLRDLEIDFSEGLRVYTTLSPRWQVRAQRAVEEELQRITEQNPKLRKHRDEGAHLEGLLIAVDNASGDIRALVGGRNFRKTQFNRAVDAKRQIGSIMKPFVYLSALESYRPEGQIFSPLTLIEDSKWTVKLGRSKTWSPENYDKKFHGLVPAFFALSRSLNSATAQLGMNVGLDKVIDVAERAGISALLEPVPSLSLGAFEVLPLQVAEAYMTLARWGEHLSPSLIHSVQSLEGAVLYERPSTAEVKFDPPHVAALVSMLQQTVQSGTARAAGAGFPGVALAGKTGTTSDLRDTWFVGFGPQTTVLTWVGFDDNRSTGLTGASGALPLWMRFAKDTGWPSQATEWSWPTNGISFKVLSDSDLAQLLPQEPEGKASSNPVQLVLPETPSTALEVEP